MSINVEKSSSIASPRLVSQFILCKLYRRHKLQASMRRFRLKLEAAREVLSSCPTLVADDVRDAVARHPELAGGAK